MQESSERTGIIAFQGEMGAYSHGAITACYPAMTPLACPSFEDALAAVKNGEAELAMIPIENSTAGRVADIHVLLPGSDLFIVREHFEPIKHCLMAKKDTRLEDLTRVTSHIQALGQCRRTLRELGLKAEPYVDTAGAARMVSESSDAALAAVASRQAAAVYGLDILSDALQDDRHNTTRFVVLARDANSAADLTGPVMTSLTFEVRNIPAALYKALGGFATNGVNITKLESYYDGAHFRVTEFYLDIVGDERDAAFSRAIDELRFHSRRVTMLGTYPIAKPRL